MIKATVAPLYPGFAPAVNVDGRMLTGETNHHQKAAALADAKSIIERVKHAALPPEGAITPFGRIFEWAGERKLLDKGTLQAQVIKLMEEVGELAKAVLEGDRDGVVDALGDVQIVLQIAALIGGYDLDLCLLAALDEIEGREGETIDGTFIKKKKPHYANPPAICQGRTDRT